MGAPSNDATDTTAVLAAAVAAAGGVSAGVVWAAAQLTQRAATGRWAPIDLAGTVAALPRLPSTAARPAGAWEHTAGLVLPPGLFWVAVVVVAAPAVATAVAIARRASRWGAGSVPRRRLGVDANPWLASSAQLAALTTTRSGAAGRFILARHGRRLLATPTGRASARDRARRRPPGGRGAVAIIGPSQSGKTTTVIAGLLDWDGPVVCSSVKTDLIGPTIGWRSTLGPVAVFDPANATPNDTCAWSPLRTASDFVGAVEAARRISEATPRNSGSVTNESFWDNLAQQLLGTCLWAAARGGRTMGDVVAWVATHDGVDPERSDLLGLLARLAPPGHPGPLAPRPAAMPEDPDARAAWEDYDQALQPLAGIRAAPPDTRSSVYITAQTLLWPWSQRTGAASAQGRSVDLGWLYADPDTGRPRPASLYLSAPLGAQARYAPVIGGLLGDLIDQVFAHHARTGERLDPPLLVVIDEAGQTPLEQLPQIAATVAGLGVQLVTVWQSKAQLDTVYGTGADTVLTNHPTKLFFSGLSDSATLAYLRDLTGVEHVPTRSLTRPAGLLATGGRSENATTHELSLLPAHVIRQQARGHALLVHANLAPAAVAGRHAPSDRHLRRRARTPLPAGTPTIGPTAPADPPAGPGDRSVTHHPDGRPAPPGVDPATGEILEPSPPPARAAGADGGAGSYVYPPGVTVFSHPPAGPDGDQDDPDPWSADVVDPVLDDPTLAGTQLSFDLDLDLDPDPPGPDGPAGDGSAAAGDSGDGPADLYLDLDGWGPVEDLDLDGYGPADGADPWPPTTAPAATVTALGDRHCPEQGPR